MSDELLRDLPARKLEAGDTVTVNGEEMKVLSVDETGNPTLATHDECITSKTTMRPPVQIDMKAIEDRIFSEITEDVAAQHDKPELVDVANMNARAKMPILSEQALEMWGNLVRGLIRKSKGLKPEDVVELPNGEEGRYIAYALDNAGRLSPGKGHGRRKVRLKSYQAMQDRLAQQLFGVYLSSLFRKAQAIAKAASTAETTVEMKPISQEDVIKAQKWAAAKAEQLTNAPKKLAAKLARKRQKTSRRINAGVIPGDSDRRSHASA